MKIVADVNGTRREAYKVGGVAFKCFPSGTNLSKNAEEFATVADAAEHLRLNPSWGIRMNPGSAIVYGGIRFE